MAVFRVEKNRDYTTMSNFHLKDKKISLKAKGLLSQILSLPDDWNYSISGLAAINRESRDSIRTAIAELEDRGYIVRHRLRSSEGKLGDMEYVVYERPVDISDESEEPTLEKPMLENPTQVNPTLEKPTLENATQLNTNRSNTDISSTKESSKDGMKAEAVHTVPSQKAGIEKKTDERIKEDKRIYGEYRNVFLTDSDLLRLKEKFPTDYGRRIERLSEYMESSGKTYRNHYLTICQWARRDAEREKGKSGRRRFENYECEEGESY